MQADTYRNSHLGLACTFQTSPSRAIQPELYSHFMAMKNSLASGTLNLEVEIYEKYPLEVKYDKFFY